MSIRRPWIVLVGVIWFSVLVATNRAFGQAPPNDTCLTGTTLNCASCAVPFDTTNAHSNDTPTGALPTTAPAKDIWFHYQVQQPPGGNCTSGRVVVSTIGACFNSKIQLFKVPNCTASISTQCNTTSLNGANLNVGGTFVPLHLLAGPPVVNVGPFVYGRSNTTAVIGSSTSGCWKIRLGGLTESDFGPGILRVDFKCEAPGSSSWDPSAGRCCFWDAVNHSVSCQSAPYSDSNGTLTPPCCARLGGYLRNTTNFYEDIAPPPNYSEVNAVGCATLPCPTEGEACFNAWDLNVLLGGGFGVRTRTVTKKCYFRYTVPQTTPIGSAIVLNTTGSTYDTAMATYRDFNLTTGECDGSSGNQVCLGAPYSSVEFARSDSCGNLPTTCMCLNVVQTLASPQEKAVAPGGTIYIGVGLTNSLPGSQRPFIDPIRADGCSSFELRVTVTNDAICATSPATGACCTQSPGGPPTCQLTQEDYCQAIGGSFLGGGSYCSAQQILVPDHTAADPSQWTHQIVSLASICSLARSRGADCASGPAKIDPWSTSIGGGANCENFGSPANCPIPADFFAPGSDSFTGSVCFHGGPIGIYQPEGFSGPLDFGNADTLVRRSADPFVRGEQSSSQQRTVSIVVERLSLLSDAPITVTYNGGQNPEQWDARVEVLGTAGQPGGSLTAVKDYCNGGTFSSTLAVCPRMTFTKVSDPGTTRVLNFCAACNPGGIVMQTQGIGWVHDDTPNGPVVVNPVCTAFHAGVSNANQPMICDCNHNGIDDQSEAVFTDIPTFVIGLLSHASDAVSLCMYDVNADSSLDGRDVQGFVKRILGP